MNTHDALLAAVLANPDDDLPRLVYADWLEENGQAERAEFIRQSVADGDVGRYSASSLMVRDYRPYTDVPDEWPESLTLVICRGFVSEIYCTMAEWCGGECRRCHGSSWAIAAWDSGREKCSTCNSTGHTHGIGTAVVRSHPVQRVTITDREPMSGGEGSGWLWFGDQSRFGPQPLHPASDLPQPIRDMLTTSEGLAQYPTRDAAESALSAALLKWAKAQPTASADE